MRGHPRCLVGSALRGADIYVRQRIERTPIERELGRPRFTRRKVGSHHRGNFGSLISLS
jgi:hypothetical protein